MFSAALDEAYATILPDRSFMPPRLSVMEPAPDDTLTIVRVSRFFSSGYSAWVTRKEPTVFVFMTRMYSLASLRRGGPALAVRLGRCRSLGMHETPGKSMRWRRAGLQTAALQSLWSIILLTQLAKSARGHTGNVVQWHARRSAATRTPGSA